jgi:hypothetical protein
MTTITDTYRATTLPDARAAALQAIETMWEDGYEAVCMHAERTDEGCAIAVTYSKDEPADPMVTRIMAEQEGV